MRRALTILVLAMSLFPLAASASTLCIPATVEEILADGMIVTLPGGSALSAYTFNTFVDCETHTLVYCTGMTVFLCFPAVYEQGPNIESEEVVWILNNYYPAVPGMPGGFTTDDERASAVQLALWHFTDGLDISGPGSGTPLNVFDAARAIILAAETAVVPPTPTSMVLATTWLLPAVEIAATLFDQNGVVMPGVLISWSGAVNGSGTTDESGQVVVPAWTWTLGDAITFDVDYTIPIGLSWVLPGCQDLIQGVEVAGNVTATWAESPPAGAAPATWGRIKSLYR